MSLSDFPYVLPVSRHPEATLTMRFFTLETRLNHPPSEAATRLRGGRERERECPCPRVRTAVMYGMCSVCVVPEIHHLVAPRTSKEEVSKTCYLHVKPSKVLTGSWPFHANHSVLIQHGFPTKRYSSALCQTTFKQSDT